MANVGNMFRCEFPNEFTQEYSFFFPNLVLKVSTNLKSLHIDFKFSLPNSPQTSFPPTLSKILFTTQLKSPAGDSLLDNKRKKKRKPFFL